jgi:hypothetical protein
MTSRNGLKDLFISSLVRSSSDSGFRWLPHSQQVNRAPPPMPKGSHFPALLFRVRPSRRRSANSGAMSSDARSSACCPRTLLWPGIWEGEVFSDFAPLQRAMLELSRRR